MEPSLNTILKEWETHILWYDKSGILCGKTYPGSSLTMHEIILTVYFLKEELKGKKACLLLDFSNFTSTTKEMREYINKEFSSIAKSVAMISNTPLGRMMANLFFSLKKQPYPTKMFENEEEAKEWLLKYL